MATPERQVRKDADKTTASGRQIAPAQDAGVDGALSGQARLHGGDPGPLAAAAVRADPLSAAAGALSRRVQRKAARPRDGARGAAPGALDPSFDRAVAGPSREVPHRRRMEAAFGTDFGNVTAHVGDGAARDGLHAMSAEAAARGEQVAFRDAAPTAETVAHELAHVVQQRQAGTPAPARLASDAAPATSAATAEAEAETAARNVAAGRPAQVAPAGVAAPVRLKGGERKAPLDALDELLAATPQDPAAIERAVRKLGSRDRTDLKADASRMSKVIAAYKAGSLKIVDLATRLDGTLLLTVQWLREAGMQAEIAEDPFGARFRKAPAAQVRELAGSAADVKLVQDGAPTLGPLQVKAIAKSGTEVAATVKDPPSLDWMMKAAGTMEALAAALPKAALKTLKTDTAALDTLLAHPTLMATDEVPLLKQVGLTPPGAVPRLAAAKAAAQMAGPTFPGWFHADSKRKELDKFVDTTDLDALKGAALKEVQPLQVEDAKPPVALGTLLHDRRKFQEWAVESQGWRALLEAIAAAATGAMVKALAKSGGNWTDLLSDITTQRKSGEADAARAALDALFAATPNGSLDLMKTLFEARFGVQVGSGTTQAAKDRLKGTGVVEKDFGPKGLRHIYEAFKVLPPSQAEAGLLEIMTRHSEGGSSSMSGFAYTASPHLSLQYAESDTEKKESGAFTHKDDVMRGMNMMDTTAVHELGHKVDTGGRYSRKATFLALADWKEHSRGATLIKDLRADMTTPLGDETDLSKDDKALLVKAAELASTNRRESEDDMYPDLQQAYADLGKAEEPAETDKHKDILDLWAHLQTTNLARHVGSGHEKRGAWWREPFGYMGTRQYHEGYQHEPGWWSYANTARSGKLSIYQFRNPADHFAELYATYWCSRPVGGRVPADMKKWFEDENLNK